MIRFFQQISSSGVLTFVSSSVELETPNQINVTFNDEIESNGLSKDLFTVSGVVSNPNVTGIYKGFNNLTLILDADIIDSDSPVITYSGSILKGLNKANTDNFSEVVTNKTAGRGNVNTLSGFSNLNYFSVSNTDDIDSNDTSFTVSVLLNPNGLSSGSGLIVGKTNSSNEGWAVVQDAGVIYLRIRDGLNNEILSRGISFTEKDLNLSLITFSILDGVIYASKNGEVENTTVSIEGVTNTATDTFIGSSSSVDNGYSNGIVSIYLSGSKGLNIKEHYENYLSISNSTNYIYNYDLVFTSVNGNANMIDLVSGVVATKNGTITVTSVSKIFNKVYNNRLYQSLDDKILPELPNDVGGLDMLLTGDSITNSFFGTDQIYAKNIGDDLFANLSSTNLDMVGLAGASPYEHNGYNGSDVGTQLNASGSVEQAWVTTLGQFLPDVIPVLIGTNATTDEANLDNDLSKYNTFLLQVVQNVPNARLLIISILEHDDSFRRSRINYYNYEVITNIIPSYSSQLDIKFLNIYDLIRHESGDFADVVHPNDQGYNKITGLISNEILNVIGK